MIVSISRAIPEIITSQSATPAMLDATQLAFRELSAACVRRLHLHIPQPLPPENIFPPPQRSTEWKQANDHDITLYHVLHFDPATMFPTYFHSRNTRTRTKHTAYEASLSFENGILQHAKIALRSALTLAETARQFTSNHIASFVLDHFACVDKGIYQLQLHPALDSPYITIRHHQGSRGGLVHRSELICDTESLAFTHRHRNGRPIQLPAAQLALTTLHVAADFLQVIPRPRAKEA